MTEQTKKFISRNIDIMDLLDYEIRSSWWASYIWWSWGQELSARYFVWKTKRKYKQYLISRQMEAKLAEHIINKNIKQ